MAACVRLRRFSDDDTHPPLVLLPGGHGNWMHWLRNVEALSAAHAVAARHAGLPHSDTPPKPASGRAAVDPLARRVAGRWMA
jgi:pimeloyl-ACP methyl ester carboxylesterase